ALVENLVLAAEVVVQRGLGDVEPFGDVVERGAVIALFEKELHRRAQYRLALLVAGAAAAFERRPRRLAGSGGGRSIHFQGASGVDSGLACPVYYPWVRNSPVGNS